MTSFSPNLEKTGLRNDWRYMCLEGEVGVTRELEGKLESITGKAIVTDQHTALNKHVA